MTKLSSCLLACWIFLSGCSSLVYTTSMDTALCESISGGARCPEARYKTLIGTRKNIDNFKDTDMPAAMLFLVDMPLSLVLDVVFFIYTIPRDLINER